jgi:hypothetical protein
MGKRRGKYDHYHAYILENYPKVGARKVAEDTGIAQNTVYWLWHYLKGHEVRRKHSNALHPTKGTYVATGVTLTEQKALVTLPRVTLDREAG